MTNLAMCTGVQAVFQELHDMLKAVPTAGNDTALLSVQDVLTLAITAHATMGSRAGPGGFKPFADGAQAHAHESQKLRDAVIAAITQVSLTCQMHSPIHRHLLCDNIQSSLSLYWQVGDIELHRHHSLTALGSGGTIHLPHWDPAERMMHAGSQSGTPSTAAAMVERFGTQAAENGGP